eukprot:3282007-Amphidinium_carterae.1
MLFSGKLLHRLAKSEAAPQIEEWVDTVIDMNGRRVSKEVAEMEVEKVSRQQLSSAAPMEDVNEHGRELREWVERRRGSIPGWTRSVRGWVASGALYEWE